jgi:hypothetical protein
MKFLQEEKPLSNKTIDQLETSSVKVTGKDKNRGHKSKEYPFPQKGRGKTKKRKKDTSRSPHNQTKINHKIKEFAKKSKEISPPHSIRYHLKLPIKGLRSDSVRPSNFNKYKSLIRSKLSIVIIIMDELISIIEQRNAALIELSAGGLRRHKSVLVED